MNQFGRIRSLFLMLLYGGFHSGAALAQGDEADIEAGPERPLEAASTAADPPDESKPRLRYIEEVVVTAQKREQAAFDVPMSISAISGDTLEKMGADGAKDIALATPSFSVTETAPGSQSFQMRGISSFAAGTRATVGFYLDDVSLTALPGFQVDAGLYDVQRVEVLRGPQGTLYGEGSMGGTLKLVTNSPDFDGFTMDGRGLHYRTHNGESSSEVFSAINVPLLADKLAARLVLTSVEQGGFITQTARGEVFANWVNKKRARLRLSYEPNSRWNIQSLIIRQDLASGTQNYADDDYQRADRTLPGSEDIASIYNLSVTRDLNWASALFSYSYSDRTGEFVTDGREVVGGIVRFTGIPAIDDQFESLALSSVDEVRSESGVDSRTHVAELRMVSTSSGKLQWTGGLFYRDAFEVSPVYLAVLASGTELGSLGDYNHIVQSQQYAMFMQLERDLKPWLNLAGGLRYFYDKGASRHTGTIQMMDASNYDPFTFDTFNPRLVASFRGPDDWRGFVNEILGYASISKGFRSGGANLRPASDQPNPNAVFKPDFVWTYEIGGKAVLWDGLLSAEGALFFNDWKDVQITASVDGTFFTSNAGNAEALGLDWNFVYRPLAGLELSFSGNVIDGKFVNLTADKQPGDPLDYVPPRSGSLAATYTFDWSPSVSGLLRADYNYQDRTQFLARNTGTNSVSDPLHMIGARVGFESAAWQFYIFGRNLGNFDGVFAKSTDTFTIRLRPINFGVELKLAF